MPGKSDDIQQHGILEQITSRGAELPSGNHQQLEYSQVWYTAWCDTQHVPELCVAFAALCKHELETAHSTCQSTAARELQSGSG